MPLYVFVLNTLLTDCPPQGQVKACGAARVEHGITGVALIHSRKMTEHMQSAGIESNEFLTQLCMILQLTQNTATKFKQGGERIVGSGQPIEKGDDPARCIIGG